MQEHSSIPSHDQAVAGAWVDRLPRKPVMLVCDLGSLIVLASVPVAAWFGVLTLAHLVAAALLAGVCSVFFTLAYRAYLPVLVADHGTLIEANSTLQAGSEAATIAGPGLGGLLTQLLGAASGCSPTRSASRSLRSACWPSGSANPGANGPPPPP